MAKSKAAKPKADTQAGTAGRPSKCTDEVLAKLERALQAGNTRRAACAFACVSEDSLARWLKDPDNADFAARIKGAEAGAERAYCDVIRGAAESGNWQAAAWWLERRYPDDYGKRERMEHTGKDGGAIEMRQTLDLADLTNEELDVFERVAARRAAAAGGDPG